MPKPLTIALSIFSVFLTSLTPLQGWAQSTPTGKYLGGKESTAPDWFKESFLDFEEDIADAAANGKRLMLYFHQSGCPYCAKLVEHNFGQRDIVETMLKNFDSVDINMWGDREVITIGGQSYTEKQLAAALKVMYTPTLIFFTEERTVALRINGYYPPENFRVALEYVAGKHEKDQPYRQFFAARKPPPTSGKLASEPFFAKPPYDLSRPAADGRPRLVLFEQSRCADCDRLHQRILRDPTTRTLMQKFEVVQLDMWSRTPLTTPAGAATTAREWADELEISFSPAMVFFDVAGREVMRIDAFLRRFHTQSVFDYVLTGSYRTEPSFQRYISARADRLREQGIDVNIWQD